MTLRAGDLDRRIAIERAEVIDDGKQRRAGPWSPLMTLWAQYRPGRGSERFAAASQRAEMPVAFRVRWSPAAAGITAADRVRYPATETGAVYAIVAPPVEIGRREGIELQCLLGADG